MRLKDKVVVITGAAGWVGFSLLQGLLERGSQGGRQRYLKGVGGQAVQNLRPLGPVVGACAMCAAAGGRKHDCHRCPNLGRLDILVNNAGGSLHTPHKFEEIGEGDWDKVLDVNLKGTFICCQSAVKQFRTQGGGRIVNISALAGRWLGSLAGCHYTSAKAGVIGLTRHLATSWGPKESM